MSEKYRVAVIGRTNRGNYGHGLDTVWLAMDQAELVAVADEDKQGLQEAKTRLGVKAGYSDYREMLRQERPQIVSVAPRWLDCHHDMVLACAEYGASIFLEKPMCRTLAEADAMVQACERSHVKLAIAHQTRYSPKIQVIKDLIAEGRLGRVLEFCGRGKEDRRGGGEDLWVLGTHIFDLMRIFGGKRPLVLRPGHPERTPGDPRRRGRRRRRHRRTGRRPGGGHVRYGGRSGRLFFEPPERGRPADPFRAHDPGIQGTAGDSHRLGPRRAPAGRLRLVAGTDRFHVDQREHGWSRKTGTAGKRPRSPGERLDL